MSRRRLLIQSGQAVALVVLLASLLSMPLLFAGYATTTEYEEHYRFSEPAENFERLVEWLRKQPGVREPTVQKRDGEIIVRYWQDGVMADSPALPWKQLGYERPEGATLLRQLHIKPGGLLWLLPISQIPLLAVGTFRIRRRAKKGRPGLRLNPKLTAKIALIGLATGLGAFTVGIAHEALLRFLFGPELDTRGVWAKIGETSSAAQAAIIACGVLLAPVCEEVFFRGSVYASFAGEGFPKAGAVVAAGYFTALHFDPVNTLVYFAFAIVFAFVYQKSRSIIAPVIAHATANLMGFLVLVAD